MVLSIFKADLRVTSTEKALEFYKGVKSTLLISYGTTMKGSVLMSLFSNFYSDNIIVDKRPNVVPTTFNDAIIRCFRSIQYKKERDPIKERAFSVSEEVSLPLNIIVHLYKYAFIDLMTGLKNRNAYEETVLFLRDVPSKLSGLRVVMIDIDDMKSINDNYGHDAGDAAIKSVGKCIARAFDPGTLTFRYGGDEFICFSFNDISKNIKHFNQLISLEQLSVNFSLNASVGFVEYDKTFDSGIDALIKRCDNIMYFNKKAKKALNFEADFKLSV